MEQHLRMRESAEQHGRPTVPVSGLYFRMEDHDHTKRFKNHMRLKLLGTVAWLEFPTRKRRRQFVLPLSPDGEDAIRIDWSPAYPEWKSGRLQLVVEEGERGIREKRGSVLEAPHRVFAGRGGEASRGREEFFSVWLPCRDAHGW